MVVQKFLEGFPARLARKRDELGIETNDRKRYGVRMGDSVQDGDDLKLRIKSLLRQDELVEPCTHIEVHVYVAGGCLDFSISATNTPIYIYGEYTKMSREMSQTEMPRRGGVKMRAVADFIRDVAIFFGAKKANFIGSGREDFDVRMVGGRPFLVEITEPTRSLLFTELRLNLHAEVSVRCLKRVTSQAKAYIHENQESKSKVYSALIYSEGMRDVDQKSFEIAQQTPLRVLHRRANMVRDRSLIITQWTVAGKYALAELESQAGTYIKEFVHGDFGRTSPSITSLLGTYADCLELDVLRIDAAELPEMCIMYEIARVT